VTHGTQVFYDLCVNPVDVTAHGRLETLMCHVVRISYFVANRGCFKSTSSAVFNVMHVGVHSLTVTFV